ncbi:MAG: TRL domain-containing protein [Bacteroidota bacterium]
MKKLFTIGLLGLSLTSCVSTTYMITDNEVGTKTGVAKVRPFNKDADFSIEAACRNGGITKVGTVETKYTQYWIFMTMKTTVTGE